MDDEASARTTEKGASVMGLLRYFADRVRREPVEPVAPPYGTQDRLRDIDRLLADLLSTLDAGSKEERRTRTAQTMLRNVRRMLDGEIDE